MVFQKGGAEGREDLDRAGARLLPGSRLIPEHRVLFCAGVNVAQARSGWEDGSEQLETFFLR